MKNFNITEQQTSLKSLQLAIPEIYSNDKNKNYFATKQFDNWDEVFESPEFLNIFGESYTNHINPTINRMRKFEFVNGLVINEKVYAIYKSSLPEDNGLEIMNQISLGSCLHNGGFHAVLFISGILTIVKQNWANTPKNRKEIARQGHTIIDTLHL